MAVKAKIRILIDELLAWEILEPRNEDDSFVAVCKQLGLSVEAKDSNALISLANDAIENLTEDLRVNGDVIPFLLDHGIRFRIERVKELSGAGFVVSAPTITTESESALSA
jgi:hypothetical protein